MTRISATSDDEGHAPSANTKQQAASPTPDSRAARAALGTSVVRFVTRTWNSAMAAELITTATAAIHKGAAVSFAIHSGRPVERMDQHSARVAVAAMMAR